LNHSFGWQIVAGSICVDKAGVRNKKVKSVVYCPPPAAGVEVLWPVLTGFLTQAFDRVFQRCVVRMIGDGLP
jgi:hypothetical protein